MIRPPKQPEASELFTLLQELRRTGESLEETAVRVICFEALRRSHFVSKHAAVLGHYSNPQQVTRRSHDYGIDVRSDRW